MSRTVTISVDEDILALVDSFVKENGMTRSGLFAVGAKEYIESRKKLPIITGMFNSFAQLLDDKANGRISDSTFKEKLTDFTGGIDGDS